MSSSKQAGFAYLWTLLLVAFLGVGSMVGAELYATSARRDKERELLFIGHSFRAALQRYVDSASAGPKGGQYPPSLEELLRDSRQPGIKRHLRELYRDPMTGKAEWGLILQAGRIVGIHSLSEQTPIKQANFDDADGSFKDKQRYSEWRFTYPADLVMVQKPPPP